MNDLNFGFICLAKRATQAKREQFINRIYILSKHYRPRRILHNVTPPSACMYQYVVRNTYTDKTVLLVEKIYYYKKIARVK